jgi:hypothetical protein
MADDDTTRIMRRAEFPSEKTLKIGSSGVSGADDADPVTRLFRPKSSSGDTPAGSSKDVELVVGWLVVLDGPGRGQSRTVGFGVNGIGRGELERISLNFGDSEISRERHAVITYDHKGRRFFIQHGGGANLTYIGDEPVLQPMELKGREIIGIGQTKLCLVPFCGPEFGW